MTSETLAYEPMHADPASAERTAGSVPRLAGRYGATRRPRPNGKSVLLTGQVAAHDAHRFPFRRSDGACGRHVGAWHRYDLGCRHPDLGCQPDRRGSRCRYSDLETDARNALPDPALHWPGNIPTGLPAAQGRSGSAAVDQRGHLNPRDHWQAAAPLLLDQRVEGTRRARWSSAGYRVDPSRLVLQRGTRPGVGTNDRLGLLQAHRWHRALVVSSGAQAWRQAGGRLAIRLSPPVPQIREHSPLFRLCSRPSVAGRSTVATWISHEHRSVTPFNRTTRLPRCVVYGTGITCAKAVNSDVLSGASRHVLSGASPSCHQAHKMLCRPRMAWPTASLNLTNLKALTCYWETARLWTDESRPYLAGEIRP